MAKDVSAHTSTPSATAPGTSRKEVPSAPELPHAVARQYGLHLHIDHAAADTKAVPVDPLDDAETAAAVDDIAAADSDALLAAEDAAAADRSESPAGRGAWRRIGGFFAAWWRNRWARYTTLLIIAAGITAAAVVPQARYFVLNGAGVRSTASVVVLDTTTRTPLKNVKVTLADKTVRTTIDGVARFEDMRLGPTTLHIKRVAFAPYERGVTIGWGSNPLGEYRLQATGVQYAVVVKDYLSGKPVKGAEAVSDEANAVSDGSGKLVLTVEDTEVTTLPVGIRADGYRTEELVLDAESEAAADIALVPAQRHFFVSRQNGTYDVHSMYVDGKDRKVLLAGTGNESANISLAPDASGTLLALSSTRDGMRDRDGYMLYALTLINAADGSHRIIDHGAQVQLVAWKGERLVYRVAMPGASAANPQRYRLMAYNTQTEAKLQLASANQFTASHAIGEYVYYAASSNDPKAALGLFRIKPDGSGKKRVLDGEVWTAFRTAYDTLSVQQPDQWLTYALSSEQSGKIAAPSVLASNAYVNDPENTQSLWIAERDGKSALMLYDITRKRDTALVTHEGLAGPLRWLGGKAVVYRIATGAETADYVVSTAGGEPRKLSDVVVSYGTISE